MNSFFNRQFNYCLLIWMLLSRCHNKKNQAGTRKMPPINLLWEIVILRRSFEQR